MGGGGGVGGGGPSATPAQKVPLGLLSFPQGPQPWTLSLKKWGFGPLFPSFFGCSHAFWVMSFGGLRKCGTTSTTWGVAHHKKTPNCSVWANGSIEGKQKTVMPHKRVQDITVSAQRAV